jgi:hypothetical protein
MKINPSSKRPCRLERGDVRRVPQERRAMLVGYHLCCPRCGFVCVALVGHDDLVITEGEDNDIVTFSSAVRCVFCRVLIHLDGGELRLEEDADVRNVRYR